ncbi:hypothetical protein X917_gp31 [Pseudomonas phage PPpW-4]|uniref:Uncharacterized protein n=1 Tax=Pseudomonas phage PPpW-4 TaxID=1279083 RepID=V5YTI5_9CAUD|nr:hypothetical protein X917_gp31 [Pseudomonas phage PPpW-4]BAO20697.1 hypothetical protein [Pseudomonas phage PPpW-4]
MLSQIQHYIDKPDDIPDIPRASAEYLKVRLNASYLERTGVLDDLQRQGWSEGKILGFIQGCAAVTEIIELMQSPERYEQEGE